MSLRWRPFRVMADKNGLAEGDTVCDGGKLPSALGLHPRYGWRCSRLNRSLRSSARSTRFVSSFVDLAAQFKAINPHVPGVHIGATNRSCRGAHLKPAVLTRGIEFSIEAAGSIRSELVVFRGIRLRFIMAFRLLGPCWVGAMGLDDSGKRGETKGNRADRCRPASTSHLLIAEREGVLVADNTASAHLFKAAAFLLQ